MYNYIQSLEILDTNNTSINNLPIFVNLSEDYITCKMELTNLFGTNILIYEAFKNRQLVRIDFDRDVSKTMVLTIALPIFYSNTLPDFNFGDRIFINAVINNTLQKISLNQILLLAKTMNNGEASHVYVINDFANIQITIDENYRSSTYYSFTFKS